MASFSTFRGLGFLMMVVGGGSSCLRVNGVFAEIREPFFEADVILTLLNQSDISETFENSLSNSSCMTRAVIVSPSICRIGKS